MKKITKASLFLCYNRPIFFSSFTMIVQPFAGLRGCKRTEEWGHITKKREEIFPPS
jgi:hypothetical protein